MMTRVQSWRGVEMKKKMGRPKLEIIKNKQISVKYTEEQYKLIQKKAIETNKSIAEYIRDKSLQK